MIHLCRPSDKVEAPLLRVMSSWSFHTNHKQYIYVPSYSGLHLEKKTHPTM